MVRIGTVGCLLELTWIVEIRQQISELLDFSHCDPTLGIVGALSFRQTRIPAIDPGLRLAIPSRIALQDRTALVLKSPEGNWALLVDQVGEIYPAEFFTPCVLPRLLQVATQGYYSKLELMQQEPLIVLDPEQFYGSTAVVPA